MYHSITIGGKNTMAQLNPKEMQQALAKPFAPEDLEWRLQNTIEEKMRGLAVPYVTNRAIQNRLDEVCGPENWYNDFKPWHMAYSDIMDYLHGQKLRAVLEDDPEYFYEGRFTVNVWKSFPCPARSSCAALFWFFP